MTSFEILAKTHANLRPEYAEVCSIAADLRSYMELPEVREAIVARHVVGAKSGDIQEILLERALNLGFRPERAGLFSTYSTTGLRPDYYRPVGTSGILMEVERGKTLPNNMDLLDLWKCHICHEADYLFLVVPMVRQTASGGATRMFDPVVSRLRSFFVPRNYVNVEAVFVYGY
jgi:hypothetical protein